MDDVLVRDTTLWEITFPMSAYIEKVDTNIEPNRMQAHTKEGAIDKAIDVLGNEFFTSFDFDAGDVISIIEHPAELRVYVNEPNTCGPTAGEQFLVKKEVKI